MSAPLHGLRVLDLGEGMAASVATMLLADYGADVVHVRLPGAEALEATIDTITWDRGKRVLAVDPDEPADLAAIRRLAAGADVVIDGLDHATRDRLGFQPTSVIVSNPEVIYVALTALGLGEDLLPPYEPLVAAHLGAMVTVPSLHRRGPVFPGHPAIAYSTAFITVIGVLAALRARILTGHGDVLDVSMRDGVLGQFTMNWWSENKVASMDRRADGELDLGTIRMVARRFVCADGRHIGVHTGANGAFTRLMKLLGIDDRISPVNGPVESASPLTPEDLAVLEELPAIFAQRTSTEWLDDIWANEIAGLPVNAPGESFTDPQVVHNGAVRTIEHESGELTVVGPPIQLRETPALLTGPNEMVDRDVAWRGDGFPVGDAERLDDPLAGIRIVEMSTFFAAPYANRFLRDLGAEVIKLEPVSGDPMRSLNDTFSTVSKGKRSLAIDVKAEATRPAVEALLRSADIVQHNFRPGAAERLGVDDASVRAINPTVIYDYAPGYGSSGPKSALQSFAPLHSGFAGLHTEAAGEGNGPIACFGNEDYYNGQLNAIAQLLALVHRERTGVGQYVECPQLSSAVFVTSHWYGRDGELISSLPPLDHDQDGWGPYQRVYQCLEGWICVFCVDDTERTALRRVMLGDGDDAGTIDDAAMTTEELEQRLVYEAFGRTADEWVEALKSASVPCTVARENSWLMEYLADETNLATGRATEFEHPTVGRVRIIGDFVRLASRAPQPPTIPPRLGEHSLEVLDELGIDQATRDEFVAASLVTTARPTPAPAPGGEA